MTDEDTAPLHAALEALIGAATRDEVLDGTRFVLGWLRERVSSAPLTPELNASLVTLGYGLNRAAGAWGAPGDAETAALLAEAAGYGELERRGVQLGVLAEALARLPGPRDAATFNASVAQRVAAGTDRGHFGLGVSRRRMLDDPAVDARGLLQVVDALLDRAPAGSSDRPRLLLDRAHALLLLSRQASDPTPIVALAHHALGMATRAQNELVIGADDPWFWLERPLVAAAPEFGADGDDRHVQPMGDLRRALQATSDQGDELVSAAAIAEGFAVLLAPGLPSTVPVMRAKAALARALLVHDLDDDRAVIALFMLADSLSLSAVQDNRQTGALLESEAAARRALELRPDWPPAITSLVVTLAARGAAAGALPEAEQVLGSLTALRIRYGPTWLLLASIVQTALRAGELGASPTVLHEALMTHGELVQLPDDGQLDGRRAKEDFLRLRCLIQLAIVDPALGLPLLVSASDHRPANFASPRLILLRAEAALPGPVRTAAEAAAAIGAEADAWPGERTDQRIGILHAFRNEPPIGLPRLVPDHISIESVIAELVATAGDSAESLGLALALSEMQSDDEPERWHEIGQSGAVDPELARVARGAAGLQYLSRYLRTGDESDLGQAVELVVPADPADDLRDPLTVLNTLDAVALRDGKPLFGDDRRIQLVQHLVRDERQDLRVRFHSARRMQEAFGGVMWGIVWSQFAVLASDLRARVHRGDATDVLRAAQGTASRAVYAAVKSADPVRAVELAEQGQGILAAAALQQHGVAMDLVHLEHPVLYKAWTIAARRLQSAVLAAVPRIAHPVETTVASEPPTRRISSVELFNELSAASPQVAALVAAERAARSDLEAVAGSLMPDPSVGELIAHLQPTGARMVYLMATWWGGMAMIIHPDGRITPVDLPALTSEAAGGWIEAMNSAAPEPLARDPAVRGAATEPPQATTEEVLGAMSAAVAPLAAMLETGAGPIQLVPMGALALLPVTAALQWDRGDAPWFELSIAASGRLHLAAGSRRSRTGGNTAVVAVTNPAPATRADGTGFRDLPAASREGDDVVGLLGGVHHTRAAATLAASVTAFGGANRVLHFAVHGEADADSPERSRMYLADADGSASELTAGEVARSPINSRLVYLGSCWTGRPGERLPDEAVGFPTMLLQAGAAGVVAPLWPIDDGAAYTFAAAFYRAWHEGGSPASALAAAMRHTRAWHPRSMTWAAFALHGC